MGLMSTDDSLDVPDDLLPRNTLPVRGVNNAGHRRNPSSGKDIIQNRYNLTTSFGNDVTRTVYEKRVAELVSKRTVNPKMYYLNKTIPSVAAVTISKYTKTKHVLICTSDVTEELYDLIRFLRARALSHHEFGVRDIVILCRKSVSKSLWKRIGIFKRLYFGS